MPLGIIVPEGFVTCRQYAEKHLTPVEVVRLWARSGTLPCVYRGLSSSGRRLFVQDVPPPVKRKPPFDDCCPVGYIPLGDWCVKERISYDTASKKVHTGELRNVKLGGRYYLPADQTWIWPRPKDRRSPIVYKTN
jgi:hypothetical protein